MAVIPDGLQPSPLRRCSGTAGGKATVDKFVAPYDAAIAHDRYGSPVYLARSA